MFLLVFLLSSQFPITRLGSFLLGPYLKFSFNRQLLYSVELASKEKSNCNNVIFGVKAIEVKVIYQQSSKTSLWLV